MSDVVCPRCGRKAPNWWFQQCPKCHTIFCPYCAGEKGEQVGKGNFSTGTSTCPVCSYYGTEKIELH